MKVYQIITESANSAAELKASFEAPQWANIICYFLSQRYNPQEVSGLSANSLFDRANRLVGKQMADTTQPSQWQTYARQFGMQLDVRNPTWNDIFNHLSPHVNHACEITMGTGEAGSAFTREGNPNPHTPESRQEVFAMMTGPESFNSADQIASYMRDFLAAIARTESRSQTDPQGKTWLDRIQANNRNNELARAWELIYREYVGADGTVTTVTRDRLNTEIYRWLLTADELVARRREAENNTQ
jgi:hypothetical protein